MKENVKKAAGKCSVCQLNTQFVDKNEDKSNN